MFGFGPILTLVDSISGGGGFVPYSPRYLGSNVTVTGSVTIPTGATSLTITLENAGGGGAKSFSHLAAPTAAPAGRCVKTIAIDPADAAKGHQLFARREGNIPQGIGRQRHGSWACSVSAPVALVMAPSQWRRRRQAGQADRHRAQSTASGGTATSSAVGDITRAAIPGRARLVERRPLRGRSAAGAGAPAGAPTAATPFGGIGFSMSWDGADYGVARVTFAFTHDLRARSCRGPRGRLHRPPHSTGLTR